MIYYVSATTPNSGCGSKEYPFKTINEAASVACAGDEILVAPGIYREYVNPVNGGSDDRNRITYRSTEPLGAVIKGSEIVKDWKLYKDTVWVAEISNGLFGDFNPYTTKIEGDWHYNPNPIHTGEVYLNGRAMYEVFSIEDVEKAETDPASWEFELSRYKWYTLQKDGCTIIYANFLGADPNKELVEINVRKNCFMPDKTGINYITVSGFAMKQAATNWAPPTAYQDGLIGPHWSKGWIIEDCEISNSRCSGISLGKYLQPQNNNKWLHTHLKDGTQTQRDAVCLAVFEGWTKENIGSHIVRRCNIHDCGQTGIVGHMGGAFSLIEDNHIHHINNKQDLMGAEIGGIKMHAAIDVIFRRNHIHHCTRGIWLDWEAQGTRVTQNLFHDNVPPKGLKLTSDISLAEDLFIEVSHGPTLVDNNLLLSSCSCRISAQGIAMVHNLITGSLTWVGGGTENSTPTLPSPRYTPYHFPHRTEIAGFMTFLHGDIRFYNNIFIQQEIRKDLEEYTKETGVNRMSAYNFICGTKAYDGYPTPEKYFAEFTPEHTIQRFGQGEDTENRDLFYQPLPVYTGGNVYFNGAKPCDCEKEYIEDTEHKITCNLTENNGIYTFQTNVYDYLTDVKAGIISTETLGQAFEPEEAFENPNGSPVVLNMDFFGNHRSSATIPGPFASAPKAPVLIK